jgi:hypothetical protein
VWVSSLECVAQVAAAAPNSISAVLPTKKSHWDAAD